MRIRPVLASLALSGALLGCGKGSHTESHANGSQAKTQDSPHLPQSVSPGWKLTSLTQSAPPASVPAGDLKDCWEANYTGMGAALVWLCRYPDSSGALRAFQTAKTERQIMTLQEGRYLVVVEWVDDSIADLTALVSAVKENLNTHPGQ